MNIPVGDYVVVFFDINGKILEDKGFTTAAYLDAERWAKHKAVTECLTRYSIFLCLFNSGDKIKDRWDVKPTA